MNNENRRAESETKTKFIKKYRASTFDAAIAKVLEECTEKLNSLNQHDYMWNIAKLLKNLPLPQLEYKGETELVDFDHKHKEFFEKVEIFQLFSNLRLLYQENFLIYPNLLKWACSILLTLQEREEIIGEFVVKVIKPMTEKTIPLEKFIEVSERQDFMIAETDSHELFYLSFRATEQELKIIKEFIGKIREGVPVPLQRISDKTSVDSIRCERVLKELTTSSSPAGEYLELEGVFIKSGSTMEAFDSLIVKASLPPFYCQLCGERHMATISRIQCRSCGRYVCLSAYEQMTRVGRTSCPMCDGLLSNK